MEKIRRAFSVASSQFVRDVEGKQPPVELKVGNDYHEFKTNEVEAAFDSSVEHYGLIYNQLTSMNDFYQTGINQIVTTVFSVDKTYTTDLSSDEIDKIHLKVKFTNTKLTKPQKIVDDRGREQVMIPPVALIHNKTYSAGLSICATIEATAYYKNGSSQIRKAEIKDEKIAQMPVMVNSDLCHLSGLTAQQKLELNVDPEDQGGYFIIEGIEWVVSGVESLIYNQFRNFLEPDEKTSAKVEVIDKFGDTYQNSTQIVAGLSKTGQIYITISRDKYKNIKFPFFAVFKILGCATDAEIFDLILLKETKYRAAMSTILNNAYKVSYDVNPGDRYDKTEILETLALILQPDVFPYLKMDEQENKQQAVLTLAKLFNEHVFPHKPDDPAGKCRELGRLINILLLTHLKIIQPTDRDSFTFKRIHPTGISLAKAFKLAFNKSVIQTIYNQFKKAFSTTPFDRIVLENVFKINGLDFESKMMKSIKSGNNAVIRVGSQSGKSRVVSQQHGRKNPIHTIALMRQQSPQNTSNTEASDTERSNLMRRVHSTFIGYACIIHSVEGKKVGIVRQDAQYMHITKALMSDLIKNKLLEDPEFLPVAQIDIAGLQNKDSKNKFVFVNGDWVGAVQNAIKFASKYRNLRREGKIHQETTIYYEMNRDEVYFWVDAGRMVRPLLIVYNNKDHPEYFVKKYKTIDDYRQMILYTPRHAQLIQEGKLRFTDLLDLKIMELVSAEESENYIIAANYKILTEAWNDETQPYTHCDVPQSQLGITALTSPLGNMNQTTRWTFQCNQGKSTCGYYANNWPFRTDREAFLQYSCEIPLVRTKTAKYVPPNGYNAIVAIAIHTGYNQDDSIIGDKAAFDCGAYNGSKFTYEIAIKEDARQSFCVPNITTTANTKAQTYSKLCDQGYVPKGTFITKGDAIIGMVTPIEDDQTSKFQFQDISLKWSHDEDAFVHNVFIGMNEDGKSFIKIAFRKLRKPGVGDKFSSRHGQKGVLGKICRRGYNIFTTTGITPTLIINPHAIPSRMTIGQLVETLLGTYCARQGTYMDATSFTDLSLESIIESMRTIGFTHNGYHRMISGVTGLPMGVEIFMGPTYYQRLQKFTADTKYAIGVGRTDAKTRQPVPGKAKNGAPRLGEMELWVLHGHGASQFLAEKIFDHSNGYFGYICKTCGTFAKVNNRRKIYECIKCRNQAKIFQITTSWTSKMIFQKFNAMNIATKFNLEGYCFEQILEPNKHWIKFTKPTTMESIKEDEKEIVKDEKDKKDKK